MAKNTGPPHVHTASGIDKNGPGAARPDLKVNEREKNMPGNCEDGLYDMEDDIGLLY